MHRIALLLFLAVSAACADTAPPVQRCIDRAFAGGYGAERDQPFPLEFVCPGLVDHGTALSELPLQNPLGEDVTPAQLLDLRAAYAAGQPGPAATHEPDPKALGAILETMDTASLQPGLWERLRAWLREHFRADNEAPSWLVEWLKDFQVDEDTAIFIFELLLVAIVLTAIGVVLNELMKADLRVSGSPGQRKRLPPGSEPETDRPDWGTVAALPRGQRPAALLRYLVDALDRAGVIPTRRAWTYREYTEAVRNKLPGGANAFARLATAAEMAVYGNHAPDEPENRQLLENAEEIRGLLEQGV